jgi:ABC-type polysaccharide/polyol phosphate transport system ATPase subunit
VNGPAVRVEGLWEAYRRRNRFGWQQRAGEHWALRDVSLAVDPGRALGVIGGNGSGKTTLLQVVAGVLRPTRGRVLVHGRTASLVDLSAGFHRDLTGHENLRIGAVLLGLSRRELRRRYDDIVDFTGLAPAALDAPLASYSAGMGLRLGFSLVVNSDPDVLLVDEVLAVGDEAFQQRGVERVRELQRVGCAVIIVSHDLDLISAHCQEVAVLADGEVAHLGPPEGAVAHYRRQRDEAHIEPPADAKLFGSSWRVQAARRRRGV